MNTQTDNQWQDGRPNWATGEIRLWIENTEAWYYDAADCESAEDLADMFTGRSGPRVDWETVDWSWIWDLLAEDREAVMSSEHIKFVTVGFAELLANLPDDDDQDVIWSEPELADYWPDTPWSPDDAPENSDDHYTETTDQ